MPTRIHKQCLNTPVLRRPDQHQFATKLVLSIGASHLNPNADAKRLYATVKPCLDGEHQVRAGTSQEEKFEVTAKNVDDNGEL